MNRKDFLSGILPLTISLPALAKGRHSSSTGRFAQAPLAYQIPPYLRAGDTIGICCGSGYIEPREVQPSVILLEQWGYKTLIGQTVGLQDGSFGGTDAQRTKDLQDMLDNPEVKAILFARGGYGLVRIIDDVDFSGLIRSPKWLIGFSDVSVVHAHVHTNCRVATLHSKMCNSFPENFAAADGLVQASIDSIQAALSGQTKMSYTGPNAVMHRVGTAEGVLIGGNFRTLENLAGTRSDFTTDGKILFIEDVEEYYYNLDRMMMNFRRTGKLTRLKGLIAGGFVRMMDDPKEPFGKTHYDIISSHVQDFDYPVCFDFPVGHLPENYAYKCGVMHRLEVTESGVRLYEI